MSSLLPKKKSNKSICVSLSLSLSKLLPSRSGPTLAGTSPFRSPLPHLSMDRKKYFDHRWKFFEGLYRAPTDQEIGNLTPFMFKYAFEDDDFDEDADEDWVNLKRQNNCPNLRHLLIQLFRQVRESKGYDVNIHLPFVPMNNPFTPCWPPKDKKTYDKGMNGAEFAMHEINMEMMAYDKRYEFISLDNYVRAPGFKMYLTITAKEIEFNRMEIDDYGDDIKTIQALVFGPYVGAYFIDENYLMEWRIKTDFDAETCLKELVLPKLHWLTLATSA